MLGIIGGFIVLGAIAVVVAYEQTPVPTQAMAATGYAQSVVYSSSGTLIGRFGTTNRQELPYNQIPQSMINAVLAAEDRSFWSEGGVSPTGIVRAAYEDVSGAATARCRAARPSPSSSSGTTTPGSAPSRRSAARSRKSSSR